MSNYQDSQEEINSEQDIFAPEVEQHTVNSSSHCNCTQNTMLLQEILKELKEMKKKTQMPAFSIEKSPIERPLTDYLKGRFSKNPFLSDPDLELKNKIMSLGRRYCQDNEQKEVLRTCLKFSARKMVDFRAQTKNKILSTSLQSPDYGSLGIEDLRKALYGRFCNGESEETMNLTVTLRSFCHEKRLLRRQNGEPQDDFWGSFKLHLNEIWEDKTENKWRQLREREEKRIERYNK